MTGRARWQIVLMAVMCWLAPALASAAEPSVAGADWETQLATGLNYPVLGNEIYRYGAFLAALLAGSMLGEAIRFVLTGIAERLRKRQRTVAATVLDATTKHTARIALIFAGYVGLTFLNLRYEFLGNSIRQYIALAFTIYLSMIAGEMLHYALARLGAVFRGRSRALIATACDSISRSARLGAIAMGLFLGARFLSIPEAYEKTAESSFKVLASLVAGFVAWRLVDVVERWLSGFTRKTNSRLDDMLLPVVKTILRTAIGFAVLTSVASNTGNGEQLTAVLAGVSVGGLAVGLAAQESIKNFFGSIMIFSDRPFELGDMIRVDSQEGRVEAVGFRSTRLRTVEGHLVTIPNGDLAGKTILNIAKRPHLRRQITLRLHPNTAPEKVERAVEIVRGILADHEGMDPASPPQVTFSDIQDTSLTVQATYYFPPQEGSRFAAFNERVNFEIIRGFHGEGIELAAQRLAA